MLQKRSPNEPGVTFELSDDLLNPITHITDKDIEYCWFQYGLLRDSTHYWYPLGHWAIDYNISDTDIQSNTYPSNSPSTEHI